jgi:hypothetical protein
LYSKAHEKLEKELDVVSVVRALRKLRLMSKILFD